MVERVRVEQDEREQEPKDERNQRFPVRFRRRRLRRRTTTRRRRSLLWVLVQTLFFFARGHSSLESRQSRFCVVVLMRFGLLFPPCKKSSVFLVFEASRATNFCTRQTRK